MLIYNYIFFKKSLRLKADKGRILYMTCSLFPQENQHVTRNFLEAHLSLEAVPLQEHWKIFSSYTCPLKEGMLTPYRTNTDGYYMAIFK